MTPSPKRNPGPPAGMFGGSVLPLGRWMGIRIGVDPSWFIVFFLVTTSLADGFGTQHEDWSPLAVWTSSVSASLAFFVSILLHELGHSITAKSLGVSVRSITLFLFGGAAELGSEPRRPRDEFLIAIAGPAVSGLLGLLFLVIWIGSPPDQPVSVISMWLGVTNFGVAVFNMFPGFPLDGGRVLRAILWHFSGNLERATLWSGRVGVFFGRLLIAMGLGLAVITEQWFYGLFVAFMGWFLVRAARGTVTHSIISSRLRGIPVEKALEADLPEVDGWDTLEDVANGVLSQPGQRLALVAEDGHRVGIIGDHELSQIAEGKRAFHLARQVMTPLARLVHIDPRVSLLVALRTLDREHVAQLLVLREGEFLGVLTRDQLKRVLHAP